MRRTGLPCDSPQEFKSLSNHPFSRPIFTAPVIPPFPLRDQWIHLPPPPPPPPGFRGIYSEPPSPPWHPRASFPYSSPRPCILPPPPPPFYASGVYVTKTSTTIRHTYSHPYLPETPKVFLPKQLIPATPTSSTHDGLYTQNVNPSESPRKQRASSQTPSEESYTRPKRKKHKSSRKKLVDKEQVEIKEEKCEYKYSALINELHPEILATWRNNISKPKEDSGRLKIEICYKKKKNRPDPNIEIYRKIEEKYGVKIQEQYDLKITQSLNECEEEDSLQNEQHLKQMSSSNSTDDEKSSIKETQASSIVPFTRVKKRTLSEERDSALRFTPSQVVQKNPKNKNDKRYSSSRSSYVPIVESLNTIVSKDDCSSPSKSFDKDRSTESGRNNKHESHRSSQRFCQESDSGLESYRSREGRSRSPSRSIGGPKSKRTDLDSDSDSDVAQNSSIYVTPEGTPFSKRPTKEERPNSSFKRSFSEECNDESFSANSSFNSSNYFTPESSPRQFNFAKRQKTRWSDASAFGQDKSFSSWRHNTSSSSEQGIQPELIGYQMVGDSQFCRFGTHLLGLERVAMPNCPGRIGICVSGQTITDLHRRVRDNFYPISDKIILMIGTNDFLRNVEVTKMCEELSALIKTLQKSASNIILLTLPPIPKLEKKNPTHFKLLEVYNRHIRSLENGETLRIADVSPLYMTSPPYQRCRMHLFEMHFNGPTKRLDLIHLNRLGLDVIRKYILDKFL